MLCLVCVLIGLATGAAFRVVLLLPMVAVIGAALVLHALTSRVGLVNAAVDFLTCVVALNLGYIASALLPLSRRGQGRQDAR